MYIAPKSNLSQVFSGEIEKIEDESKKQLLKTKLASLERDLDSKSQSFCSEINSLNVSNSLGINDVEMKHLIQTIFNNLYSSIR